MERKSGFYVELDKLREEYPGADFGFLENTEVTGETHAHGFLHGCCDEFAAMLSEMYGYEIECVRNAEGRLIHAYCIAELEGKKAYIDVRGTTTDPVLFFEEFENELTYFPEDGSIMVLNEDLYEVEARIETWKNKDAFFDGEYEGWEDEDIKRFIREQRDYYNPEGLREGVFVKRMLFHVTLMENVESIREKGLLPQIGERSLEAEESEKNVYLFTSYEAMDNALMNWLGEWYNERYGEDVDLAVLKVLVPPEIPIVDEGVGYEVLCPACIPPEYISFFDELGQEIGIPLYRYELYCDGEYQEVGFLAGIEDIGLSIEKEERLLRPFTEKLTDPWHPQMSRSVSFFSAKGNEEFCDAIRELVSAYEGSMFEVKLVTVSLPPSMLKKAIYKDEYQVCLPMELYKEELENLKKVSEPKFESEFIKVVSMEKVGSLEQKICWADSKRKEVITKEICNKGYEERI